MFNTITGADWARELKRARETPNTVREQIRAKLDSLEEIQYNTGQEKIMNILKYLPEKSEYAVKFAEALKPYHAKMYVIGSAARKGLYGLQTNVNDYNFLISCECDDPYLLNEELEKQFPGKVSVDDAYRTVVDAETFTAKISWQPVDQFLTSVRFAGDGLAVRASDDRPVVIPEYMAFPPCTEIVTPPVGDAQLDPQWEKAHLETLEAFGQDLFNVVQKSTNNAPTKS